MRGSSLLAARLHDASSRSHRVGFEEEHVRSSSIRHFALSAVIVATMALPLAAQDQVQVPQAEPEAAAVIGDEWTHWTSGRYRITAGDVMEVTFPFVPELNQTVAVQPDGYVSLRDVPDMRLQGRTLAQAKADILAAYATFVREPVINVSLKEFEKPYFVASGEVENPGRFELRGATTLTQALALAGGPARGANVSEIVLLRRHPGDAVEATTINVRRMLSKKNLSEDPLLRPGDTIYVPMGIFGKLQPILETPFWWILR